ncbi:hypothetical protein VP01_951g8 [Puccinia sorghi]|uniref:Uncharacterized protein n=1 Tax=Puccinia sorghi TaxID=27349 RepID=A0A0L6U6D4_9BASI|nr:hypothetical protein VP01_951g8 [Puccinia sorghi]
MNFTIRLIVKLDINTSYNQLHPELIVKLDINTSYNQLHPEYNLTWGYGIRCNIKYESHRCAYNTREILNSMLCEEFVKLQDQITRQSHKQYSNWMQIKHLRIDLKKWRMMDIGAFVLANHYQTIKDLKKKEETGSREDSFHLMYHKMTTQLEEYQEEALECEALKNLNKQEAQIKKSQDDIEESEKNQRVKCLCQKNDCLAKPAAKDQKSLLIWWKVLVVEV